MSDVTQLLSAIDAGDPKAADQLLPLVYGELRKLAVVRMANEKAGQTLQPTALVHEAWLKIAGDGHEHFANRRHCRVARCERRTDGGRELVGADVVHDRQRPDADAGHRKHRPGGYRSRRAGEVSEIYG